MKPNIQPPPCPNCGAILIKKEKDGREYFACPNWKPDNKGCKGYFWSPDTDTTNRKVKPNYVNKDTILMDEIIDFRQEMNERWDKLGEYLDKRLPKDD